MKKIFILFLAFLFVFLSCSKSNRAKDNINWSEPLIQNNQNVNTESNKPVAKKYGYVNTFDGINVRDEPNGKILFKLNYDEKVEILEKVKYEEIDGHSDYWVKILTENDTEGCAYGAYLSDSIEDARTFRRNEQLRFGWDWFIEYEKLLSKSYGISIETNPEWICYSDFYGHDIEPYYIDVSDNLALGIFPTYNKETDSAGNFLYDAVIYANNENYPKFLPFKIGDPVEKIYELFGEHDDRYSDGTWWHDNYGTAMKVGEKNGLVTKVMLRKWGW